MCCLLQHVLDLFTKGDCAEWPSDMYKFFVFFQNCLVDSSIFLEKFVMFVGWIDNVFKDLIWKVYSTPSGDVLPSILHVMSKQHVAIATGPTQ